MILGDLTLRELDQIYQRAGLVELVVYPYYQSSSRRPCGFALAGLITGRIDHFPEFPGKSAFLEHFIVLPEATDKLKVMQVMPRSIAALLEHEGKAERILLCIDQENPKRRGLNAWARRCGYTKFGERDGRDWYIHELHLQEKGIGQRLPEDAEVRED